MSKLYLMRGSCHLGNEDWLAAGLGSIVKMSAKKCREDVVDNATQDYLFGSVMPLVNGRCFVDHFAVCGHTDKSHNDICQ